MNVVFGGIWVALALVVPGMAIYRNLLGIHESALHVSRPDPSATIAQKAEFHKEEFIERWGQRLTVVALVYGLILATTYLYEATEHGFRVGR